MDRLLAYHVRISALWILGIVAVVAYANLAANEAAEDVGNLSLVNDEDLANTVLIMMLFAFLATFLPARLNRLTNIVASLIFTVLLSIVLIDGLSVHFEGPYNRTMAAAVVSMAAVAWFAFRLPTAEA